MFRGTEVLVSVLATSFALGLPSSDEPKADNAVTTATNIEPDVMPTTIDEARRQALLLHEIYHATLLVVHHQYYDEDERDTLPARAFEDVFGKIDARTKGKTRWISVNAPAMNVDHQPKAGFESSAAIALSNGSAAVESFGDGTYRRAAGIPFLASCSQCHQSGLTHRRKGRMAGLVISLPLDLSKKAESLRRPGTSEHKQSARQEP